MTAAGFFRGRWLWTSNANPKTNSCAPRPSRVRPASRELRAVMTGGMRTTGTGATGASADAMNEVPTQISS